MKQDMNDTFRIVLRAMVVAAMTLLAGSTATAEDTPTGPTVHGNVYGGGNAADVKVKTAVNISTGTVLGNVYGGGNVGDVGMYTVTVNDKGSKEYTWQQVDDEETGKCIVNVSGGTVGSEDIATTDHASGHVFGAGKGKDDTFECEKAMVRTTSVSIDNCTVWGNVYGGGQVGRVDQHTAVTIGNGEGVESGSTPTSKPIIKGNVFGAGAGLETHGYSALVRGNAEVMVLGNSKVEKSVYGGGEIAAVGRYGLDGSGMPTTLISGGECKVTVRGYSEIGSDAGGGVFGAGEGVVPHYYVGVDSYTDNADKPKRMMNFDESIYNAQTQNDWERIEGTDFVWEYYNTRDGYLNFLQTLALATDTKLIIDGHAKVHGSVYGGSRSGFVQRYTDVTIQGSCEILTIETEGKIEDGNVFGGGKGLTGNDAAGRVRGNITLYTLGGIMHGSVYGGGALSKSNTLVSEGVYPTSIVNLLGGTIMGDAYGGGLGNATTAADAGNTKVNLNGMAISEFANLPDGDFKTQLSSILTRLDANNDEDTNDEGVDYYSVTTTTKGCVVNRVFGANNTNGTPKGNVMVHVYGTQYKNATQIGNPGAGGDPPAIAPKEEGRYDVEAVYGGGNEAAYIPETPYTTATPNGSKSQVIIDGCHYTSIETVYGGGNAAPVPESNVEIKAAYEIGYVFGGGNGKDKKSDGSENPGADIGQKSDGTEYGTGNANSTLEGGLIHEAYGGSNQKGVIKGSINQTSDPDASACELDLRKVVGAGKYADIDQDVNMILSCQPENKVDVLFAGADEANVNGNITLTITNGNFGQVFGGNNLGGAVKGRIIVNVEETGCRPINIDELYLCGNNAAYSVYGYYQSDEVHPVTGKKILKPRESSDDEHKPVKDYDRENDSWTVYSGEEGNTFTSYGDPVLNVISCTHIGKVFGGGYGTGAIVYGNPTVSINMIPGDHANYIPDKMTALGIDATEAPNPNKLGIIGDVYGGGNAADVIGNPTVNVGTEPTVDLVSKEETGKTVLGAYIAGNVYGGGKGSSDTYACEKAMIGKDGDGIDNPDGGTTVRIYKGLVRGNVYGGGEIGRVEKNTAVTIGAENGTDVPVVMGDVFGAGKGLETHGYAALVRGNPTVTIQGKAKVLHSVYGGGQIASVARYQLVDGVPVALAETNGKKSGYCTVNILGDAVIGPDKKMVMHHMDEQGNTVLGDDGFPLLPDDAGHVFAAGKGVLPIVYDYAKPTSTVQANYHTEQYEIDEHMPKRMMLYKNKKSQYWEYADSDFDPTGVDEGDLANQDVWEYFPSEKDYFDFVETLALATQTNVTISGNAFVKGSVYGGSENGLVQYNTNVMIEGECQIGCGKNTTDRHPAAVWGDNYTVPDGTDLECASWEYDKSSGAPYDPNAKYLYDGKYYYDENHENDAAGGSIVGKDGHTYYGNVFGGGSGSVPYFDTNQGRSRYVMSAGWVKGNTNVTINGGHILTNVYGGNEATNVDGTATVTMNGGTVGVPRTLAQIDAHPVTCYLFGAGKGDQRVFFNKDTNVKDVVVNITGGRIYGSVFGGGEDGHVLRNVTMTIGQQSTAGEGTEAVTTTSGPVIGTWGTSYVDGNVFGGGRGFGGDAYTAGNVAGSVKMEIKGGTMLGSIYGGGRLGSVGYGLFDAETNGQPTPGYGEMRADTDTEEGFTDGTSNFFTKGRGHIDITISGGTIGNTHEYIVPTGFSNWTDADWTNWKAQNHISKTEFDTTTGRLTHTKGGNVFAGGMGRFYQLDGTTPISVIDWWKLGCVKSTKLTITGGNIKSNVYGGGEQGWTSGYHTADGKNLSTEISITGGTIGTEVKDGNVTKYTFGSVFGGGYGSALEKLVDDKGKETNPKFQAGRVKHSTKVDISGNAKVLASVYGGGEVASVGYGFYSYHDDQVIVETPLNDASEAANTYVSVSGNAFIGKAKDGDTYFGGATMGNVYGGGSGNRTIVRCGLILGNTNVNVSGGTIYHNIYGGGAYGSVGDFIYTTDIDPDHGTKKVYGVESLHTPGTGTANVTITGGTIGIDGHENGMVFGSSRGDVLGNMQRDDYMAWVNKTNVTIGTSGSSTGPQINGSVYGGGENGHVLTDTEIAIHGGTIGIESGAAIGGQEGAWFGNRGNVYGGGCGTDIFEVGNKSYFNKTAGIVRGNTTITMDGGHVVRNIYGGGAMGSVGKFTRGDKPAGEAEDANVPGPITACADNTGKCTITISGGEVGPGNLEMPLSAGHVFGAGRGEVHDPESYPNLERVVYVNNTEVTVKGTAYIKGSVYGGSESGHVLGSTNVKIQGGQIGMGRAIKTPYEESVFTSAPSETSDWECPSWTYDTTDADGGKAYDMYAGTEGYDAKGGVKVATDGHTFYGNVFGGGSGYTPYAAGKWLESAGVVKGNATVEITGGHILTNVYGGNECTDVEGKCTVTMSGGTVGVPRTDAQIRNHPVTCYVFGAGKGDKRVLFNTWTNVAETEVNINGGTIFGSVLGGGEDGHVLGNAVTTIEEKDGKTVTIGSVGTSGADGNVFGGGRGSRSALTAGVVGGNIALNVKSGTIKGCVYGGGRMASVGTHFTNPADPGYGVVTDDEAHGNITVNLTGGTIGHDVYGGCMGATGTDQLGESRSVKLHLNQGVGTDQKGCIIGGYVFGCNNVNSSPRLSSLVHIHATQNKNGVSISDKKDDYDVAGVFGGGNQADFVPTLAGEGDPQTTEVIIEGCDLTSIKEVYGGGYGAATPGTSVLIKGTKIIDNVFGGGYGAGATNPGANVGFRTGGNTEYGGEGKAVVKLMAGRVNNVYGGSNTKGDIRGGSNVTNVAKDGSPGCCEKLEVGKIYGGGKDAEMAGGTEIVLGCMPNDWIEEIYAGAQNADVGNDVMLTLTSGKFGRVFGGNKSGGKLDGSITVNIEESSECGTPIVIGELYGGGNEAPYSAYGYKEDPANPGKWIPLEKGEEGALSTPYPGPVLNIKSFTSIGNVYGGGFGSTATVIGNPQVFVNEVNVEDNNVAYDVGEDTNVPALIDGVKVKLYPHEADKIGVIGNVFGGGNAAKVVGDTHVNIGTVETVKFESLTDESITGSDKRVSKTVVGADIRGNVYGGGNEAEVTGDTNVVIGKEEVTTSGTGTTP